MILPVLLVTFYLTNTTTELQAGKLSGLQLTKSGRFLVRKDGWAFFPVADTAWAIAWRLNRGEVENYLQHRKAQEFNRIATDSSIFNASPVVVDGQLFLQSNRYLYCIETRP